MTLAEFVSVLVRGVSHYRELRTLVKESYFPSMSDTLRASRGHLAVLHESKQIVSRIDRPAFSEIFDQYRNTAPPPGFSKYLDVSTHVSRAVRHARGLGLNASAPLQILDIGSGPGYFPFVCHYYGHHATALDLDENEMYVRLRALLKVECIRHRVEASTRLPLGEAKYDLITGFQILFDRFPSGDPWSEKEWIFILKDLASHLRPEGRILLQLNTFKERYHERVRNNLELFRRAGAAIQAQQVLLKVPFALPDR